MSYESALEAAGFEIDEFRTFGDYQGTWWAHGILNGQRGWITGSYGSCSGCDAFEAEFGWSDDEKEDYPSRLKAFGEHYTNAFMTQEEAEVETPAPKEGEYDWDEGQEQYNFIRSKRAESQGN